MFIVDVRALESYPGVVVSSTPSVQASSLFADKHCGAGTQLIYYMATGSVLSRTFTSKDTHSPRGDLVVVYSDARPSMYDSEIASETTRILGFSPPSFTFGTDLILPVSANIELRHLLASDLAVKDRDDEDDIVIAGTLQHEGVHVPQVRSSDNDNILS